MEFNGKVHPDCPNAGNPFHECTARCFERISSGDVHKKEKKLFGSFGKKTSSENAPGSPARIAGNRSPLPPGSPAHVPGNRSPLPSYYAKRMVESDESPSFSSSDEKEGYFFSRPSPAHRRSSQTKQISGNNAGVGNDSLPMSPSLAVYMERDHVIQRPDRRRGETPSHFGRDAEMSPRTPRTRPRTPETRSRTPEGRSRTPEHERGSLETRPRTPERQPRTPETRPRTPEHQRGSLETMPRTPEHQRGSLETMPRTPERQPRTPETRPRTPEHQRGSLETMPRTPEHQRGSLETMPRTPEHQRGSLETMPRTPETRPRTPEHQPGSLKTRPRTPETRPRTPETRPRTPEHRVRSTEHRPRSPGPRSRTPEPQARYLEPRARTPEPRARTPEPGTRTPETQIKSHRSLDVGGLPSTYNHAGNRSPRTYISSGNKAESVCTEDEEDSVLLFPEILLSPQTRPASRPTTPDRRGYETPTKQEEIEQQVELESSDDDNFSFAEERSEYLYPEIVSSSDAKPRSGSSTPVHHKFRASGEHEQHEKHNEPPELPDESQSFSLSEIAKMRGIKNYDREEMQSVFSESYVSVGNYKVRASVSATLLSILDKYGDIASGSKLQSLSTRSYYLDSLASVVLELRSTPLKEMKETRVKEMLAIVKDVESVKIQVGWLRAILEELLEAAKHFNQHETTVVEKEVYDSDLLLAKQEMEIQMKTLVQKEKETNECRERVTEMGGRLGHLEMKRARMNKSLTFLKSKVEKFQGKSVLEELF